MRLSPNLALLAAAGLLLCGPAQAQPPAPAPAAAAAPAKPLDAAERKATLDDLATKLDEGFVFPEVGARYAAMLRANLKAGAYDQLTDPKAFADKVTADLQAVSADGHLRLSPRDPAADRNGAPGGYPPGWDKPIEDMRMIGKVAYIRFHHFPDDAETPAKVRDFLLGHPEAQALVIDSRGNHGGGLAVMDAIFPLIYARPTVLVRMDTRAVAAEGAPEYPTMVRQPSPKEVVRFDHRATPDPVHTGLQHAPVYYLTSAKTASAAEHLALAFRHTHRAIQIGETTRGAGHYGGQQPIGDRFLAFIPVGRTYDPDTNWDWEGKGVAPDVAVPADQALDEALKRAKAKGVDVGS